MTWEDLKPRVNGFCKRINDPAIEVIVVTVFGFVPFIINILRTNYTVNDLDFLKAFTSGFDHGQLYIFAYSLFGTLVWLTCFNRSMPEFLFKRIIRFFVLLCGLIIAGIGGIDPTFAAIANGKIVILSYFIYFIFVVFYLCLLYLSNNVPPQISDTLNSEADRMRNQYISLSEGNGQ